ncbi:MAG TPA: hypothetical protein VKT77_07415, partial [Chthonomonadaceae bacterium]|nr:hypothetical protein [Chthonomonadaceae bacterium]
FHVWNEFKGFWDAPGHNWDYVRYTELYNQVYDALKSVDSSIKVGGPYLVVEGTGLNAREWYGASPITERNMKVIDYWLAHKHGAEFIALDRSLTDTNHDSGRHTEREMLAQTRLYADIVRQIRAKTDLPIWWAEFYGGERLRNPDFVAAEYASIYLHMATAGAPQVALLWGFLQGEGGGYQLFTDLMQPDGGQPTAHYGVVKAFRDMFPPGTRLYRATSSSPEIEVLASRTQTLLINKRSSPARIMLDGAPLTLGRYEVRLLEASRRAQARP